jgi:hypothetical protein
VLETLDEWKSREQADYRRILRVLRYVGSMERVNDEKHVKVDDQRRGRYEMRAHRGHARMLFFYP